MEHLRTFSHLISKRPYEVYIIHISAFYPFYTLGYYGLEVLENLLKATQLITETGSEFMILNI